MSLNALGSHSDHLADSVAVSTLDSLATSANKDKDTFSYSPLSAYTPPTAPRHQQTRSERERVLSLSNLIPIHEISTSVHLSNSTVKRDLRNPTMPTGNLTRFSGGGDVPSLSYDQEGTLAARVRKLRSWFAEVTPVLVRVMALLLFASIVHGFKASYHWYVGFLKRNHLREYVITSPHSSVTSVRQPAASSKDDSNLYNLERDTRERYEQVLEFIVDLEVTRRLGSLTKHQILAIDDTRVGFVHARKIVDDEGIGHPKVFSFGFEYNQPNFCVPVHGNGSFGIPLITFKAETQIEVASTSIASLASSSSSSSSSSSNAASSDPMRPVLVCFTKTAHTTSTSYQAQVETSIAASLPSGGILVHDSDRSHLTKDISTSLKALRIVPKVVPKKCTEYLNPADRLLNSLIRRSMGMKQQRWIIQTLERYDGKFPSVSASDMRALAVSWFRDAYYSLSVSARTACWSMAGLLVDNPSEASRVDLRLSSSLRITASDIRDHVSARLKALSPSATSSASTSTSSSSSSSSPPLISAAQLQSSLTAKLESSRKSFKKRSRSRSRARTSKDKADEVQKHGQKKKQKKKATSTQAKSLHRSRSSSPPRPSRRSTRISTLSEAGWRAAQLEFTMEDDHSSEREEDEDVELALNS